MPIRMLAFHSNGTQPRLVERSEIAEQIKSRILEKNREELEQLEESESIRVDLVKELARYAILSHTWFRGSPGDVVYSNWDTRESNVRGERQNCQILRGRGSQPWCYIRLDGHRLHRQEQQFRA